VVNSLAHSLGGKRINNSAIQQETQHSGKQKKKKFYTENDALANTLEVGFVRGCGLGFVLSNGIGIYPLDGT
jgi:hypothetical protein